MSILFNINKELNGIEIQFSEKPTAEILGKLKALGFRWNPKKFVWYAKNTEERLEFAKSIQKEDKFEQITLFPVAEPKAEPTKVEKVAEKPKAKETPKATSKAPTKGKEEPKKATTKAEPKKDNVINFLEAKKRPEIKVRLAFDESATLDDCIAKIEKEKAVFKDSDSLFVLDGLLEMCKVNENFRNNFMRESKTYAGAFKYFSNLARQGYAHVINGVTFMDNNLALGFAMDYYNMVDEK